MKQLVNFSSNIERLLEEILVKKKDLTNILDKVYEVTDENIGFNNEINKKMYDLIDKVEVNFSNIETKYKSFVSKRNSFIDGTTYTSEIVESIENIFYNKFEELLTKIVTINNIMVEYFQESRDYDIKDFDFNMYDETILEGSNRNRSRHTGGGLGYDWFSIKAKDDYLRNNKSVLSFSEISKESDNSEYINPFMLGGKVYENIIFHPKFGLIHYMDSGTNKTNSPLSDNETNKSFFNMFVLNNDSFKSNMNIFKNVDNLGFGVETTPTTIDHETLDLDYHMILRHNDDMKNYSPSEVDSYFIMKSKTLGANYLKTPSLKLLQRHNLENDIHKDTIYYGREGDPITLLETNIYNDPIRTYSKVFKEDVDNIYKQENGVKYERNKTLIRLPKSQTQRMIKILNIEDGTKIHTLLSFNLGEESDTGAVILEKSTDLGMDYDIGYEITNSYKKSNSTRLLANLVLSINHVFYNRYNIENSVCYNSGKLSTYNSNDSVLTRGVTHGVLKVSGLNDYEIINPSEYGFYNSLRLNKLSGVLNTGYDSFDLFTLKRLRTSKVNRSHISHWVNHSGSPFHRMDYVNNQGVMDNSAIERITLALPYYNLNEYYDIYLSPLRKSNVYFGYVDDKEKFIVDNAASVTRTVIDDPSDTTISKGVLNQKYLETFITNDSGEIVDKDVTLPVIRQNTGVEITLNVDDLEYIYEAILIDVQKYYDEVGDDDFGHIMHLPYGTIEGNVYNEKFVKLNGCNVSKDEFPRGYQAFGDRYIDDAKTPPLPDEFTMPDLAKHITYSTLDDSKMGLKIKDHLPNDLSFEANFVEETETDRKYGALSNDVSIKSTSKATFAASLEGVGSTSSKIEIEHNSSASKTSGNTFSVDFFMKLK